MEVCHTSDEWTVAGKNGCVADASVHAATHLRQCAVLHSNHTSCPLPKAKAWDHHDGEIAVVSTSLKLYLKSDAGVNGLSLYNKPVDELVYTQRGEYLFTFDANDDSGNAAESLNYVIQMVDEVPPHEYLPS
jgi:hypothetical protein